MRCSASEVDRQRVCAARQCVDALPGHHLRHDMLLHLRPRAQEAIATAAFNECGSAQLAWNSYRRTIAICARK
jgi:hypothetical protein